jgi:hypothetical protein
MVREGNTRARGFMKVRDSEKLIATVFGRRWSDVGLVLVGRMRI